MPLNKYQKVCYRWFGSVAELKVNNRLKKGLQSAHIELRAGAYLSLTMLNALLVLVVSFIGITIFSFILLPLAEVYLDPLILVFFLFIPLLLAVLTYFVQLEMPASKAKARGRKIDINLAYALNFISAMSSAGVTPTEIFRSLSKQEIYGEIREEATWIYRDICIMGYDVITAIKNNIERTPSKKFKEFLQGMVVTVTSGGSLKSYFMNKAEQYLWENRQSQKQLMESLGIMAESYVTAAVAGILLLLIVIPLMMIITSDWNSMFLYILIFMLVPIIHTGFSFVIRSMVQTG